MARMFADNILETSQTLGTATYELDGPVVGYRAFADSFVDNDTPYYMVRNKLGTKYELNRGGVFTEASTDTLTRSVIKSTNSDNAVSWQTDDLPLSIFIPTAQEAIDALIAYDDSENIWLPTHNHRKTHVDKGAADYTALPADEGLTFIFDTSAAQRTLTLPPSGDIWNGYKISVESSSDVFPLAVDPDAGDGIDGLAAGALFYAMGKRPFDIYWNGTKWRTSIGDMPLFVVREWATGTDIDFKNVAENIDLLEFEFWLKPSADGTFTMRLFDDVGVIVNTANYVNSQIVWTSSAASTTTTQTGWFVNWSTSDNGAGGINARGSISNLQGSLSTYPHIKIAGHTVEQTGAAWNPSLNFGVINVAPPNQYTGFRLTRANNFAGRMVVRGFPALY